MQPVNRVPRTNDMPSVEKSVHWDGNPTTSNPKCDLCEVELLTNAELLRWQSISVHTEMVQPMHLYHMLHTSEVHGQNMFKGAISVVLMSGSSLSVCKHKSRYSRKLGTVKLVYRESVNVYRNSVHDAASNGDSIDHISANMAGYERV